MSISCKNAYFYMPFYMIYMHENAYHMNYENAYHMNYDIYHNLYGMHSQSRGRVNTFLGGFGSFSSRFVVCI